MLRSEYGLKNFPSECLLILMSPPTEVTLNGFLTLCEILVNFGWMKFLFEPVSTKTFSGGLLP